MKREKRGESNEEEGRHCVPLGSGRAALIDEKEGRRKKENPHKIRREIKLLIFGFSFSPFFSLPAMYFIPYPHRTESRSV